MQTQRTQIIRERGSAANPIVVSASGAETNPQLMRTAYALSAAVAFLMIVAAAFGIFVHHLYAEGAWAREAFRGGDLVTLVVAAPLLLVAILRSMRGSRRAQVVWIGGLAYALYNYAFYVFGAKFNEVFLVHIAVLSLSILALACALLNLDATAVAARLGGPRAARWVGGFLVGVGGLQGALWIGLLIRNAITGKLLQDVPVAGQHLVFALDLTLLTPALVVAGVSLWRGTALGYVLGGGMLVMGTLYQLNAMLAGVFQARADVAGAKAFPPEGLLLTLGFLTATALLLRGGGRTRRSWGHWMTSERGRLGSRWVPVDHPRLSVR